MKVRARSKSTSGRFESLGCVWISPYTVLATADVAAFGEHTDYVQLQKLQDPKTAKWWKQLHCWGD